jgi:hypothetical protein
MSALVASISATVPWLVTGVKRVPLALALGIGIALSILCAVFAHLYPWTNLLVLLVGIAAGVLLGRSLPERITPFAVVLLVLSALDMTQIALAGHGSSSQSAGVIPPPGQLAGNFFLLLPWGRFNIGIFDIFLFAAIAEHCRRRGFTFLFTLLPSLIGLVFAYAFLQFFYHGPLPLIPFLTAGWLAVVAFTRYHTSGPRVA